MKKKNYQTLSRTAVAVTMYLIAVAICFGLIVVSKKVNEKDFIETKQQICMDNHIKYDNTIWVWVEDGVATINNSEKTICSPKKGSTTFKEIANLGNRADNRSLARMILYGIISLITALLFIYFPQLRKVDKYQKLKQQRKKELAIMQAKISAEDQRRQAEELALKRAEALKTKQLTLFIQIYRDIYLNNKDKDIAL